MLLYVINTEESNLENCKYHAVV